MLVTCTACWQRPAYLVRDFLNTMAIESGIGNHETFEDNVKELNSWGFVIAEEDYDKQLNYEYVSKTISTLLDEGDSFFTLKNKEIISSDRKEKDNVYEEEAEKIIDRAVEYINNRTFSPTYDYAYNREIKDLNDDFEDGDIVVVDDMFKVVEKKDDEIVFKDAEFEDVFAYLEISDTYYIDFEQAEVIPYGEEIGNTAYVNETYNLLASNNHVFNSEGFRISYTLNKSGIDVHISRNDNGVNIYGDLSVHNVKPSFRWLYEENDLKNCYFDLKFNTTEKIGASIGKYGNYHVTLKDVDSSSFRKMLSSIVEKQNDEVEATIPICKIKTPIPDIPTAYLNFDVLIKLYVSGKAELVLYNSHELGFETRNGNIRFINEGDRDIDAILQASSKAALGLNISLEAVKFRLADVELDGGVRGVVKSTMHLYDEDGNARSEASDIAYSTLSELSDGNPDVKICGDLSLYYLLDLMINTSKTQMAKLGFSRTYNIMDDDNQIFGNLSHLEDGHFVKKCTRKNRDSIMSMEQVKSNRIVLNSYAEVLKKDESFKIEILSLPEGYSTSDIVYSSDDNGIARVNGGTISPVSPGSTRINVHTADGKYSSYVNVLVSTG